MKMQPNKAYLAIFFVWCWKNPRQDVVSEVKFIKTPTGEGHLM